MSKSWDKDWMEREAARRRKEDRLMRMVRGELDRRDVDRDSERATRRKEDVPVFSECVIGYRQWHVDALDQLWPITVVRRPWLPGVNEAVCDRTSAGLVYYWSAGSAVVEPAEPPRKHAAPHEDCECGLYAWRRPRDEWGSATAWVHNEVNAMPLVVGAVAFWGDVRVHREGFRAEKACVVSLAYRSDERADVFRVLERVAARYKVALVAYSDLEADARRHGAPLPESLQPPSTNLWQYAAQMYLSTSRLQIGP
jgi:hypothetical protein